MMDQEQQLPVEEEMEGVAGAVAGAPEVPPEAVDPAAPEAAAVEPSVAEAPAEGQPEVVQPESAQAQVAPAEAAAAEATQPEDAHPEMDWFIIHTYSGFENKVAESLRARSAAFGFSDRLGQVLIPTEEVIELRGGRKVTSKRLLYPGYVMVQMAMDDELWHQVKNTPRVTGFVGGGTKPVPLSADEVNAVLFRQSSAADRPRPKLTFEKNDMVRIVDGPFCNFQGKVDEVNSDRSTLRVLVTIFGRSTPVELEFLQVEKVV
jgi:transcriptional antiterminator NusG